MFDGSERGLQWPALAERLGDRIPERWDGVTADAVSAQLRDLGVPSVDVSCGRPRPQSAAARLLSRQRWGRDEPRPEVAAARPPDLRKRSGPRPPRPERRLHLRFYGSRGTRAYAGRRPPHGGHRERVVKFKITLATCGRCASCGASGTSA